MKHSINLIGTRTKGMSSCSPYNFRWCPFDVNSIRYSVFVVNNLISFIIIFIIRLLLIITETYTKLYFAYLRARKFPERIYIGFDPTKLESCFVYFFISLFSLHSKVHPFLLRSFLAKFCLVLWLLIRRN